MRDIWAVLLQTLTVSGAAVLVLLLKEMFTGRLSSRWQCAVWLILLPPLLLPRTPPVTCSCPQGGSGGTCW